MTDIQRYKGEQIMYCMLADGPVRSVLVKEAIKGAGLPEGCYRSARKHLGAKTWWEGSKGGTGNGGVRGKHYIGWPEGGPKRKPQMKDYSDHWGNKRMVQRTRRKPYNEPDDIARLRRQLQDRIDMVDGFLDKLSYQKTSKVQNIVPTADVFGDADGGRGFEKARGYFDE